MKSEREAFDPRHFQFPSQILFPCREFHVCKRKAADSDGSIAFQDIFRPFTSSESGRFPLENPNSIRGDNS